MEKHFSPCILCDIIRSMILKSKQLKRGAVELRKRGFSYNEIRKTIPVAKSTLSLWLKEIPLSPKYRARLYTKQIQILSRGAQSQKNRRAKVVSEIIASSEKIIQHPLDTQTELLMGVMLYWAEGSKGKRLQITNSDPLLILYMSKWIQKFFHVSPRELKARLNIYPQQNESEIINFWSDLLKIPRKNFGKSFVKPLNKNYKKNNLYYGTIRVEVPKSTDMTYQVQGWIRGALSPSTPNLNSIMKKWECLTKTARPVNL